VQRRDLQFMGGNAAPTLVLQGGVVFFSDSKLILERGSMELELDVLLNGLRCQI